ncbi:serine hydrolase domain-containing protein [Pedobacter cryoconitis]|uniref:serine hydrolase domain-containing protein n=1 Tax=Pedobacter cryoconitis TaxID=188932 RepID=UPI001609428A|nr:serine hydrolase domain-containing protein [Pedobacter cryoconitis]MBB5644372.1 CubicO group peptidase (beta-lactamase class C family) [Pedobacter cryoconitis]
MIKYPLMLTMMLSGTNLQAQRPVITNEKLYRIDNLAQELIQTGQIAGASVLLFKDGQTIYNKAFGYADPETKKAMQTNSIFRIASQTKAITSIAAMMLWEQGKFLLDEPVSKYIPEFKKTAVLEKFNSADSSYTTLPVVREITIRDLLRHTSGLSYPVFSIDERLNAIYAKARVSTGLGSKGVLKERIELLAKQPLLHQPGEAFTYGLNTDVLGRLVEVWSGLNLNDFLKTRIFDPLEMEDTYFHLPKGKVDRLVALDQKVDGKLKKRKELIYEGNEVNYPAADGIYVSGGAGLSSTTSDYLKFLQMVLNKGVCKGERLIGEKTIELMLKNQLTESMKINGQEEGFQFGLGWGLVNERNSYLHPLSTGSFFWGGAYNTHYWVDPKEQLIGLVFTQEYMPDSYWDLGYLFKNVFYSLIESK